MKIQKIQILKLNKIISFSDSVIKYYLNKFIKIKYIKD